MTVKELIEALQKEDPELLVCYEDDGLYSFVDELTHERIKPGEYGPDEYYYCCGEDDPKSFVALRLL